MKKSRSKKKSYSAYLKQQKFYASIGLSSPKLSRYKFNKNPMDAFKSLTLFKDIPNFNADPLQGHTIEFWEKKYKRYLEQYEKATRDLEKRGYNMSSPKFTMAQFVEQYGMQTRYEKEIGRKHDAIDSLVMQQKYRYSRKLETAIRNAIEESGIADEDFKLDWRRVRQDREYLEELPIDWDFINEDYARLKESGLSSKEASHIIGQTYFGSK